MNKKQWLASTDLQEMLHFVKGRTSARKLRLFAVACARRFGELLATDEPSRQAVEAAERFADGTATAKECRSAWRAVVVLYGETDSLRKALRALAISAAEMDAPVAAHDAIVSAGMLAGAVARLHARENGGPEPASAELHAIRAEREQLLTTMRTHFGYPPRQPAPNPAWLTSDVLLLARGIYDEAAFDRTPILADALQDAGCTNNDMLNLLRHGTDLARGCWALDVLLGKK